MENKWGTPGPEPAAVLLKAKDLEDWLGWSIDVQKNFRKKGQLKGSKFGTSDYFYRKQHIIDDFLDGPPEKEDDE